MSIKYRVEIDGLRALAVSSVILCHAKFEWFSGGFIGVDIFFVISGYLITSIIISDLNLGKFSIINFYKRRIRRILPALYTVLATCFFASIFIMRPIEQERFSESLLATVLFASNFYFWKDATSYFSAETDELPLIHTWSLGVEEQFYVLFPIFLFFYIRTVKYSTKYLFLILTAISFLISVIAVDYLPFSHSAGFYLPATRAWELLAGGSLVFIPNKFAAKINQSGSIISLATIIAAISIYTPEMSFPGFNSFIPIIATCGVIYFTSGQEDNIIKKFLSIPLFVFIGHISYSLYLWHQPIFSFFRIIFGQDSFFYFRLALIVFCIVLAYLTFILVENPFRKKYRSEFHLTRYLPVLAPSLFFAALGIFGIETRGMEFRVPREDRQLLAADNRDTGNYVWERMRALDLRPFPGNSHPNVFVVGDSFSGDLLNVLAHSPYWANHNYSSHIISARCGNVFVDEDVDAFVEPDDVDRCARATRYDDDTVIHRLREADVVILASNWRLWQAERIAETIQNIQAVSDAEVIVVGRKYFGEVDIRNLAGVPHHERLSLRHPVRADIVEINSQLAALSGSSFFDTNALLCGSPVECGLFTPDGDLISFDGGHLTPEGARWAGAQLATAPNPLSDTLEEQAP